MTLEELIKTCLKAKIYVSEVQLDERDNFVYLIRGFGRTYDAKLYTDKDGKIFCQTRYHPHDAEIKEFDNLVSLCFQCDIEDKCGWSSSFLPLYLERGWLEKEEKVVTTYKIK